MYHQSMGRFITRDPLETGRFDIVMADKRSQKEVSPWLIDHTLSSMHAYARTLESRLGIHTGVQESNSRRFLMRQELHTASVGVSAILRQLTTELQRVGVDVSGIENSFYAYAGNNPVKNLDPTGLGVVNCPKAIAELMWKLRRADKHYSNNLAHWPPDPKHVKEKRQIATELRNAFAKVVKHCACEVSAKVIEEAEELIDKLDKQIDAFCRAITDRRFLAAMGWLLAAIATVLLLIALMAAAGATAGVCFC